MPGISTKPLRRLQAALPYLVVLAVGAFLYHTANGFEFEQSSGRIGPGAWPKLVLILLLLTAFWGMITSIVHFERASEETTDADEALVRPPEIYPHLVWLAVVATVAYLMLLPVIGFFLATIVYLFVLMYLGQYRRAWTAAALSLGVSFCFMLIFMRLVYVSLPVGSPPFDRLSFALMAAMGVH